MSSVFFSIAVSFKPQGNEKTELIASTLRTLIRCQSFHHQSTNKREKQQQQQQQHQNNNNNVSIRQSIY
jgi:hypothetical protein